MCIRKIALFLVTGILVNCLASTEQDGRGAATANDTEPLESIGEDTATVSTSIPKQSDWVNQGVVLTNGGPGSWDARLYGQISPCAVVKIDGTYFLYYIGADGDRSSDGGPRHRALGVATSLDGINFSKYGANPIITYLPHNNEEEGVFSCGATQDENGDVILYYGALRAPNQTSGSVDIDIRMARSKDGCSFGNDTLILRQLSDELTPVGTFHSNGTWYVFYLGPLRGGAGSVRMLSGSQPDELPNSTMALLAGQYRGGGDSVLLTPSQIALFLLREGSGQLSIEVRTASTSSPENLSDPIEEYDFGSTWKHITIFLDAEMKTWFMYQRSRAGNEIIVRTAPAVTPVESAQPRQYSSQPVGPLAEEHGQQPMITLEAVSYLPLITRGALCAG
jgi:hypothetical protein